jgi:peroxiredoxin
VKAAEAAGCQVVTVAMLGHKADVAVMAMHVDLRQLRALQTGVQRAGLEVVDSYVSLTESSEYAKGMPEEMIKRPALSEPAAQGSAQGVVLLSR